MFIRAPSTECGIKQRLDKDPVKSSSLAKSYRVQFSSVAHLCPTFCDPVNCSTPGLPVPEFTEFYNSWSLQNLIVMCCWAFNGPEPGGPESTIRKEERKRLISPGLPGKPIESCS